MRQRSKPTDRASTLMLVCGLMLVVAVPPLRESGLIGHGALGDFAGGFATGLGLTLEIGALIRLRRGRARALPHAPEPS
jgi:hypothetical protein